VSFFCLLGLQIFWLDILFSLSSCLTINHQLPSAD
jgi:hypothetical protein